MPLLLRPIARARVGLRFIPFSKPTSSQLRHFHVTLPQLMNPLLPFESIIDELNNQDLEEDNKKLKQKNKKFEIEYAATQRSVGMTITKPPSVSGGGSGSGNGDGKGSGSKDDPNHEMSEKKKKSEERKKKWADRLKRLNSFFFKCLETAGITLSSVVILGLAGFTYHRVYYTHVLDKIDSAFDVGDPAFELTMHKRSNSNGENWIDRPQQKLLDDIVNGKITGRYFLLIGEKGTGKTSILLESMRKVKGCNCTFIDAHSDPEILRIRLGRAIKFEYHEDYIGSLFSIKGPRDTTALLDIERAFNKMEEVAVERVKRTKKPMVVVINNAHLIKADEEGDKIVELLQHKAESLSGSGLVTIIFNSDDYWLYERLKQKGTRLDVINVRDLSRAESIEALQISRDRHYTNDKLDAELANKVYDMIGGRPQHLAQVARRSDILNACNEIIDREKTWVLNQCGLLGMDMDDDVMESGKFSTSAMLLVKALVELDKERVITVSKNQDGPDETFIEHKLPELPLWRARQIMTRGDYIQHYDNLNIFTIDSHSQVKADSVPMMRAFHEIATQPGFDKLLEETCQRVSDIESLGRTREIVAKDLILGGNYKVKAGRDNNPKFSYEISMEDYSGDGDNDDIMMEDLGKKREVWQTRLNALNNWYVAPANVEPDILDIDRDNDPADDSNREPEAPAA
ncbi:hypothetical protein BABINDRAFT_161075 [Babjeviella inositovora NRRL Y-12698]|uniref:Uncharacterized protein n=1 Tax=Babjeviella inositovora NRRL Y-12698 TaxID=984486 RepID=A0A1E3QT50_9ASCO|nr:uncharacterized protein BABINDRAFT_161075 [Babjeviella inositovora NRRL Y-12698]ODQ80886.1 hypothetical protein BABINDRAFT_161075 [Babjeviella inositovora NRRL Y-12698]